MTQLNILFGSDVHLKFRLRDTSIAKRWSRQLQLAQDLGYPIDDTKRFYGFNSTEQETEKAIKLINESIETINSYANLIDRTLSDVSDQDTLNYLHHVFEVYHGLLDTQHTNKFFTLAPKEVQQALANLNIHVHRCESVNRGAQPRTVVTYYGLPKTQHYDIVDYLHFTNEYQFGTVYINYVEIGKTLDDLMRDNDQYINDDAFRPSKHFSADFNIKFFDVTPKEAWHERNLVQQYYINHKDWLDSRGYKNHDPRLSIGQCPVADIDTSTQQLLRSIRENQVVSKVWLE